MKEQADINASDIARLTHLQTEATMPYLILKMRCFLMMQQKLIQRTSRTLISFVRDFPVRRFLSPAEDAALKMPEVRSSLKLSECLEKSDLNIFYLKMFPVCLTMTKGGLLRKSSLRYQTWGMVLNGRCLTARISVFPKPGKECTLSDILTKDVPEKYYLSQSATLRLLNKSLAEIRDKECTIPKDSE